jgi:hypothetical protein
MRIGQRALEARAEALTGTFPHIGATMYLLYSTTNPRSPEAMIRLDATIGHLIYVPAHDTQPPMHVLVRMVRWIKYLVCTSRKTKHSQLLFTQTEQRIISASQPPGVQFPVGRRTCG